MTSFFAARDAACQMLAEREGRPEQEHSDPAGGYGYVRPKHGPGSRFDAANDRLLAARSAAGVAATLIADDVVGGRVTPDHLLDQYRRRRAEVAYAFAVLGAEVAS